MRGASAERGGGGWPVSDTPPGPPSDMQSLPRSPHSRQQPLSTLFAVDTSAHPFPCSFVPQMRDSAPQHHLSSRATLASCVLPPTRSKRRGARDGTKGLIWGPLRCNQMRLLRGEERGGGWSIMFCRAFHCSIVAFFFLFLSGQTLMLYPLTFVVPAAMFHKHRMGNILSIRNLDCRFPPATLHSARARSHSPSPSAEALSFPLPCPLIHLNISQSAPFIRCVMYNLRQQQCQQGSMFSPTLLVLNHLRCYCFVSGQLRVQKK